MILCSSCQWLMKSVVMASLYLAPVLPSNNSMNIFMILWTIKREWQGTCSFQIRIKWQWKPLKKKLQLDIKKKNMILMDITSGEVQESQDNINVNGSN